ncbi:DUF6491 family protein [Sandaracinobacteroides hominis]|uniref:DUF6491 family protein n=1 Tax=Sandaracinobacteroides hominis TaxID=2780086 RepID=UPI0018F4A659|nr:DUF6491 family protein [Sandaracinobacteroides hominis]
MRSELLVAAAAALALAGCSSGTKTSAAATPGSAASNRTDPMTLKVTGEQRRCILNNGSTSTTPAGPNALMFRQGANQWFRNDLRGTCTAMRPNTTLVFRNASSQHCELDSFQVVDAVSRMNFGTCVLGQFTPVEVPRGTRF